MEIYISNTQAILPLIVQNDKPNAHWHALRAISREPLTQLPKTAFIESTGSSTSIKVSVSKSTCTPVEKLPSKEEKDNSGRYHTL